METPPTAQAAPTAPIEPTPPAAAPMAPEPAASSVPTPVASPESAPTTPAMPEKKFSVFGTSTSAIFISSIAANILVGGLINRNLGAILAIIAFFVGLMSFMKDRKAGKNPSILLLVIAIFLGLLGGIGALSR